MKTIAAVLLCFGLSIAACDGDSDAARPPADAEPGGGAPEEESSGAAPALPNVPGTTAAAAGASVEMGVGSYCYALACVDKIGVITKGTLRVKRGETVRVAIPKGLGSKEAGVSAFPAIGDPFKLDGGEEAWPPAGASTALKSTLARGQVSFTADLAPGLYVVSVFLRLEAGGDVSYGVLLQVQ